MIVLLLLEAVAIAFTALGCQLARRRHRQPSWYNALIAAILTATMISLPTGWHYLMREGWNWAGNHDKESLRAILFGDLWLTGMALPVALYIVYRFRKIEN